MPEVYFEVASAVTTFVGFAYAPTWMFFEAEVSRERLRQLRLQPGDSVDVVFRHVRLFDNGRYTEGDIRHGRLVPYDIA